MPRSLEAVVKRMPLDLLRKHALQRLRNLEAQRKRNNQYSRTEKARKTKQRAYYKSTNTYHPVFNDAPDAQEKKWKRPTTVQDNERANSIMGVQSDER